MMNTRITLRTFQTKIKIMVDLVENNLKLQKEDALEFIGKELEKTKFAISSDLIEKIYEVVRRGSTDQTIDPKNEIKKLIIAEISK